MTRVAQIRIMVGLLVSHWRPHWMGFCLNRHMSKKQTTCCYQIGWILMFNMIVWTLFYGPIHVIILSLRPKWGRFQQKNIMTLIVHWKCWYKRLIPQIRSVYGFCFFITVLDNIYYSSCPNQMILNLCNLIKLRTISKHSTAYVYNSLRSGDAIWWHEPGSTLDVWWLIA